MAIASTILFRAGCAGMISVLVLGAAFGHAGKLSDNGTSMFMKGQLYNVTNCNLISNN